MATMKQAIKEAFEQSEGALSKKVIRLKWDSQTSCDRFQRGDTYITLVMLQ